MLQMHKKKTHQELLGFTFGLFKFKLRKYSLSACCFLWLLSQRPAASYLFFCRNFIPKLVVLIWALLLNKILTSKLHKIFAILTCIVFTHLFKISNGPCVCFPPSFQPHQLTKKSSADSTCCSRTGTNESIDLRNGWIPFRFGVLVLLNQCHFIIGLFKIMHLLLVKMSPTEIAGLLRYAESAEQRCRSEILW